jgi:pyruvate/2-oxoglutarate dehydrogenase complex dihydrolipoamide dehydrogenase (E3) component
MSEEFDVICIGAGTAGEALADGLRGSGLSLAVIEKRLVGGECAYWGCMPSKTLLRSAETLAEAGRARELAASRVEWEVDFSKIAKRTHWMSRDLDDTNAARAIEANGARLLRGEARLTGPRTVEVDGRTLEARRGLVIASGAEPTAPPIAGLDRVDYWTNREAVMTTELPASLIVLGGGPVGVELAQAFARLGTRVQVVEATERLLPVDEPEAGTLLAQYLANEGIAVTVSAQVTGAARSAAGVQLSLGSGEQASAERLLVATGRRPNLQGFDLAAARLSTTNRGWLKVDPETLQAGDGIWGAGDVTGIGAFTYLAWYHGGLIARAIRGEPIRADHTAIPRVTFTEPEVASVGLNEAQARDRYPAVRIASQDMGNTARGYIHGEPGGVIKLVADVDRHVLLGATIVSPRAGEIISELSLAILAGIPLRLMAELMHPFPAFARGLQGMFAQLLSVPATV